MTKVDPTAWNKAQAIEAAYWQQHSAVEIEKQDLYLRMMKLDVTQWHHRRVADIGGGPMSVCLRMPQDNTCVVVDPIGPDICSCAERYQEAGIYFENVPAEEFRAINIGKETGPPFDHAGAYSFSDALCYNVLQHVLDPKLVLKRAWEVLDVGGHLHLCEFLGTPPGLEDTNYKDCHPHELQAEEMLEWIQALPGARIERGDRYLDYQYRVSGNWIVLDVEKMPPDMVLKPVRHLKRRLRMHILGIAHTVTTPEWCACAYTMKVYNLCKMLKRLGHEVIHYGGGKAEVDCDEHVEIVPQALYDSFYSSWDWKKRLFPAWDKDGKIFWDMAAANCPAEVEKRVTGQHDIINVSFGWPQIAWAGNAPKAKGAKVVEMGIGYKGNQTDFRVFESYNWLAWCSGQQKYSAGRAFDAVIWNYYDLEHFTYRGRDEKEDYVCFVARNTPDKGIRIAVQAARKAGVKIKIAGQREDSQGRIMCPDVYGEPHVEYVGYVSIEQRNELMGRARALIMPTQYWEPFGGVAVEAQLCGTPAITTDWGAYPETVIHGKTGWRGRTMQDFVHAIERIDEIDNAECRKWAEGNASLDVAQAKYDDWLQRVSSTMLEIPGFHAGNDPGPYSLDPWKKALL